MKKRMVCLGLAVLMSLGVCITSFAGSWESDDKGWWYRYDDGSYPYSELVDIDGKQYYFDENGYMCTGWREIVTGKIRQGSDGSMYPYESVDWYLLDGSGALVTEGNWDGGCLNADGSLHIDHTWYENGELFYQRDWTQGYPEPLGTHKDYRGMQGFYNCSLPWKQELANAIDAAVTEEYKTFEIEFQLPENWQAECPPPLLSKMIREVSLNKKRYLNEYFERSWSVDSNGVLHVVIKHTLGS